MFQRMVLKLLVVIVTILYKSNENVPSIKMGEDNIKSLINEANQLIDLIQ